jgi:hypothetical protein
VFKDADAVNISRSPLLRGEVPHITPALTQRYLDHLALTPAQRRWVEEEITQAPSGAGNGNAFIALQAALGSLAEGDELHARLALSLPATRHAEYPAAWLRRQQIPVMHRSSMASKPFLRSPQDALRHFLNATFVTPARRTSVRGKRMVRAAVVWGIILMGGLTAPAFAHAHGDRFQINPSYTTQQLTNNGD